MQVKEFIYKIWGKLYRDRDEETELNLEGFSPLLPTDVELKVEPDVSLSEFLFKARVKNFDTVGLFDYKDFLKYNLRVAEQFPENSDLYIVHIPGTQNATLLYLPDGFEEVVTNTSVVAIPLDDKKINELLRELIRDELERESNLGVEFDDDMSLSDIYVEFGEKATRAVDRAIDRTVGALSQISEDWDKYYINRSAHYEELPQMVPPAVELINSLSIPNIKEFLESTLSPSFETVLNRAIAKTNAEDLAREESLRRNIDVEFRNSGPSL